MSWRRPNEEFHSKWTGNRTQDLDTPHSLTVEFNPGLAVHASLREAKLYWDEIRGTRRRMPARGDLRPTDLTKCLPYVLLVDVLAEGDDFRARSLSEWRGGVETGNGAA